MSDDTIIHCKKSKPSKPKKALLEGMVKIGVVEFKCAFIEPDIRVISQTGFTGSVGISVGGSAYAKALADQIRCPKELNARLPVWIARSELKPFISKELEDALENPTVYTASSTKHGIPVYGMRAELVPDICEVFVRARNAGVLNDTQSRAADVMEAILFACAKMGMIALVDEATGYQQHRPSMAMQNYVQTFFLERCTPWVKRFPHSFYDKMSLLHRGEPLNGWNMPPYFGHLINKVIYCRTGPDTVRKLKELNPVQENGRRKARMHQFLTPNYGVMQLREALRIAEAVMTLCLEENPDWDPFASWDEFLFKLDLVLPIHPESARMIDLKESEKELLKIKKLQKQ